MSTRGMPKTKVIRQRLRKEAEQRQAEYDCLSLEEKLAKLPPAPSAKKQRDKLEAELQLKSSSGEQPTESTEVKVKKVKKSKTK